MTEADRLRALWRQHFDACDRIYAENGARHQRFMDTYAAGRHPTYEGTLPLPPFPNALRGLRCGAKNRRGDPCKQSDLGRNGRCKFHGGTSAGPITADGKVRARANLALRWLRDHEAASEPHEVLSNVNPEQAEPACGSEPHGMITNDKVGGMTEADILASIAAIAAKRRARR